MTLVIFGLFYPLFTKHKKVLIFKYLTPKDQLYGHPI